MTIANNNMTYTSDIFSMERNINNQINNKDEKFASIALNESSKSNMLHHQHGCVAVMGGKIIARGYNSDRCYSKDEFLKNTCSCHAEIDVMRKLNRIINKKLGSSSSSSSSPSSFSLNNKRSCFLWKNNIICRKKRKKWQERGWL